MADPCIPDRRIAIDAFLSAARRQGYVTVQQVLRDLGERPVAWVEIESGSYPLADLKTLLDLLRERERPPPSAHHGWLRCVDELAA